MKKILHIYYCWDEIGNPNSNQNRRQYSILKDLYHSTVVYRKFTNLAYGEEFIGITSPNLLIFDRIFLKIFQLFRLVWSINIIFWSLEAYKVLSKKNEKYDVVLLTGTPYMLFWMTKKLARKNKAKVVVQMYDPLSMNNFVGGSNFFRKKLEKNILDNSDLIIIHSKLMYSMMCEEYSQHKNKIKFVPFSSDTDTTEVISINTKKDKLTILHAGTLQNSRNLDLLIKSMKTMSLSELSHIKIQLIGYVSKKILKQIIKSNLSDNFEIIPFIPKKELNSYYKNADVLLVIDSFKNNINIFFPSKICEYLTFEKVILLLTPHLSETRWVLENSKELCFGENEAPKLKETLINLVNDRSFYDQKIDFAVKNVFLPQNTVNELDKYIKSLF